MNNEIEKVIASFEHSKSILNAMGDENRQIIILELMKKQKCTSCKGIRVNCLAKRTNLSRAAISRHLQILKDAKLVKVVKKGTMNYYYWNPDVEVLREITKLVQDVSIVAESTEEESIKKKNHHECDQCHLDKDDTKSRVCRNTYPALFL